MANHASALKAHRQSLRRRSRNRSNKRALRTSLTNFKERIATTEPSAALPSQAELYSTIDKASRKGALSKNAAARQKSRLMRKLAAAQKKPAGS